MKSSKQAKTLKHKKSSTRDWLSYVVDDNKQLVIPLGPRFQADVPEWTGPPQSRYPHKTLNNQDSLKWSGTVIWSNKNRRPEAESDVIGRGRPHRCECYNPGSILCVKSHINEKAARLQKELGPAFQIWKFDEMGEVVAKLWKQSEQQKFSRIVKTNPSSQESISPEVYS
uniref:AT-rich interactive domain-containing protein 1-like isoform X2 n=1 Tax=Erigeron canadensis TaxID=72917 RepID=UPI001CB8FB41|nr:AT-rich interactive domain-containing protein 1-like isoform X2 [Erigeron canadensis]